MNQRNPYLLQGPSLISFSGGRTSAFMLRQILDAHDGTLPADVYVTFANTGKERSETLDFVNECSERWAVPVAWLEYRCVPGLEDEKAKHGYTIVNYETASRSGEPFAELIRVRKFCPNPVSRFCTVELKIVPMKKFMLDRGHEEWDVVLGLRADEPSRCQRAILSCSRERYRNVTPMERAGHGLDVVMAFWAAQPFDLKLRQDEGNCDLCFLKGRKKIDRLIRERPESVAWWSEQEIATGATFCGDRRPSYASLLKIVQSDEAQMELFDDYETTVCNCTD